MYYYSKKTLTNNLALMRLLKKYSVVLYMGDNAGDFPIGTKGKTLAERNGIIDAHKEDFGTTFVVLPQTLLTDLG